MATPGTTYFGLTGDPLVDGVTNGYKWSLDSTRTVDFSISNGFSGEYWNAPSTVAGYMQTALSVYSLYANIKFNYLGYFANPSSAAASGSEINLSLDGANLIFSNSNTWAIGLFPNSAYNSSLYPGAPGDIYLNVKSQGNYLPSYAPGSQGWFLLMHELGHTLGLKHPHDDAGTGRPTFSSLGIGDLDIDVATVMSYNDDGSWNLYSWDPATPMVLDVLGLMYLYGKNTSTNSGDTTFTLKEYNEYLTLWDPSGSDTLDASQASSGWTILLPNTVLSNLVNEKIGVAAPTSDLTLVTPHTLEWLIGNIENVVGTSYSDTIIGNDLNNSISGGYGNDVITGGMGNDSIDGGLGTDYVTYLYARAGYSISYSSGAFTISGQEGTDTVVGVEYFKFSDQTVSASTLIDINVPSGNPYTVSAYLSMIQSGKLGNQKIAILDSASNIADCPGWDISVISSISIVDSNKTVHLSSGQVDGAYRDTSSSWLSLIVQGGGHWDVTGDASNKPTNGPDLTLMGGSANDLIDGGGGLDFAQYAGSYSQYQVTSLGNGKFEVKDLVSYRSGLDTLINIERIKFTDHFYDPQLTPLEVALDLDAPNSSGGIYRLYQAAFDRKPDLGGLGYWIKAADNGKSAVTMAEDFTWSKEFLDLFHLSTPKDNYFTGVEVKTLVEGMYTHVLHRAADSGGLNYYAGVIQSHEKTVGRVLAEISDSPENHTAVASSIANGIQYTPYTAQAMTSLHLIDDIEGTVAEPQTMALDTYSSYSDQVDLVGQTHDPMLDWMWLG